MGFLGNLWKIFERKHICITDRWLPAAAEGLPAGKECSTLGSEPQKWLEWALACAGMFMRIIITSIFLCAVLQQRLKKTSMHALQRSSPPFEWILLSRSAVLKRSPLTPLGVLLEVGGTAVAPPAGKLMTPQLPSQWAGVRFVQKSELKRFSGWKSQSSICEWAHTEMHCG